MIRILFNIQNSYPIKKNHLKKKIKSHLQESNFSQPCQIELAFVDKKTMTQLNQKYRGRSGPTDVLAFEMNYPKLPDGRIRLGEIVICYPLAKNIGKLVSHGLDHLLGCHHE